ncbi:hypothetical protein P5V15_013149 [Pogonomyrmex californicus]
MSQSRGDRGYDTSEPSTSSGHRRKPYERSSETERLGKGIVKTISHEDYSQPSTSKSTIKEEPMETMLESGDAPSALVKPKHERQRREDIFVTRPSTLVTKKGTSGRPIMLQSNHFRIPTGPNWCLYKYRVDFEPEETRTFVRKGMLKLHKEKVGAYIFDGTVLYTSSRLPDKMELVTTRQSDNVPIKIIICLVGSMSPDDWHYIIIFNIIMRKCLEHLKLQLVGRDYFDAKDKVSIYQYKLELWPGYITTIRQYENDILMSAEITHKVMRQESLLHILMECFRHGYDHKTEFCNRVIGLMVLTDYNNHTYRIEDVDFDASPSSTFPMKSGQHISYQEYYKNKYRIDITNATQPMLVTRSKPKERNASNQGNLVYLVPELCRATGLTDDMRENFQLMKALATHTCISPSSRIDKLMRFNNRLRHEPKVVQEFKDWDMSLDRNLLQFPARVLYDEKIVVANNYKVNSFRGDWTRNMQRAHLFHNKELRNWVLIGSQRDRGAVDRFLNTLLQVSSQMSFRVTRPQENWLREDKSSSYTEMLEYILSRSSPDLIFCVVSNNRSDRYAAIKKKCCIDRPVPSQVFLQKNLDGRGTMSIATKVAVQMICKLGGAPWSIETVLKGLMTIGFDICHDTNTKGKNFLSMVATVDQKLTQFFSCISQYQSSEELGEQLCDNVNKAVQAYRKHNKSLPMHLFIYRDGVSEGQIRSVYENEVEPLKKKLEKIYYGPNFKLIFIIVNKKINIRLFENRNNPPIGTIVDDVITDPLRYDFFLVSQQVRQGTVSPTSYNVIYDNTGLDAELVQQVTYKLTYLYYNCTSTVRVPALCHYARKLSFLVGRHLHKPPDNQLENQLYFL